MAGSSKILRNGLTLKENGFLQEVIKNVKQTGHINGTKAVKKIYNVKTDNTASAMASKILSRDRVLDKIERALKINNVSTDKVVAEINEIAITKPKEVSADVKLKANIELLKLLNAYPDRKRPDLTFNINTQINQLDFDEAKKKLESMSSINNEIINEAEIEASSP